MCCRSLAQSSTRFAFSPPTISICNSAAAAATTTTPAAPTRRTVHETRIVADFLVLHLAGFAGCATWNLSTRFSREDAHGRLHSRPPRIHGGIRRPLDPGKPGILPGIHAGFQ